MAVHCSRIALEPVFWHFMARAINVDEPGAFMHMITALHAWPGSIWKRQMLDKPAKKSFSNVLHADGVIAAKHLALLQACSEGKTEG